MVGFIRGRVATVLMLMRIGVCVRFGLAGNLRVTPLSLQADVRAQTCGLICGGMVLSLVMMDWSFNYEGKEFEF